MNAALQKMNADPQKINAALQKMNVDPQKMNVEPQNRAGNSLICSSLICSDRSNQISDCEQFAQIAQDRWATVSIAQVAHDK